MVKNKSFTIGKTKVFLREQQSFAAKLFYCFFTMKLFPCHMSFYCSQYLYSMTEDLSHQHTANWYIIWEDRRELGLLANRYAVLVEELI